LPLVVVVLVVLEMADHLIALLLKVLEFPAAAVSQAKLGLLIHQLLVLVVEWEVKLLVVQLVRVGHPQHQLQMMEHIIQQAAAVVVVDILVVVVVVVQLEWHRVQHQMVLMDLKAPLAQVVLAVQQLHQVWHISAAQAEVEVEVLLIQAVYLVVLRLQGVALCRLQQAELKQVKQVMDMRVSV
jgi:hypothetical protein